MTRALVDTALADAGLDGGSGWGSACQGIGATFSVSDWAEVDPLIEAMLPVVREDNIVNDILIRVEAPPVAQ